MNSQIEKSNIILKSSYVIICNNTNIDKYKLEIYTNGDIRIMNELCKTDYFYIKDCMKMIPSLVNIYNALFQTLCDKNQLDNFIIALQAVKQNLKTDFDRIKSKKVMHIEDNLDKKLGTVDEISKNRKLNII